MKEKCSINSWLSKEECATLRTIAILSIVVHNFAHKLPGAAVENEFAFNIENSINFSNKVLSSDFLIHIFSHLRLSKCIRSFIEIWKRGINQSEAFLVESLQETIHPPIPWHHCVLSDHVLCRRTFFLPSRPHRHTMHYGPKPDLPS